MNRPIKFRAWLNYDKVMTEVGSLEFFENGQEHLNNEYQKSAYTLLQFTGLLDKNGKEIYEGDIVNEYENDGFNPLEVFWDDVMLGFQLRNGNYQTPLSDYCEVIGNIYENPDILH